MAAGTLDNPTNDEVVKKPTLNAPRYRSGFQTAAASTVWYGFLASSTDPNKVHVDPAYPAASDPNNRAQWDFDRGYYGCDITGTDSTQFWTFLQGPQASDAGNYLTPAARPFWYYDYGNNITIGNHALNVARGARRSHPPPYGSRRRVAPGQPVHGA